VPLCAGDGRARPPLPRRLPPGKGGWRTRSGTAPPSRSPSSSS
jgi:hypothetical protein